MMTILRVVGLELVPWLLGFKPVRLFGMVIASAVVGYIGYWYFTSQRARMKCPSSGARSRC